MFHYAKIIVVALLSALGFGLSSTASASIVVEGTRVIYKAGKKEVTVKLTNNNQVPVLIQSWIDAGEAKDASVKTAVPFVLTPPINRVDASKGQTLRISYLGSSTLPLDKESVFWLNILEIPAKPKESGSQTSRLNVAFRTRIKLFYRPDNLPGTSFQAAENLKWELKSDGLSVSNPSSYYVTIKTINYKTGGQEYAMDGKMLAPGASEFFKSTKIKINSLDNISYTIINDYGGYQPYKAKR